MSTHPRKLSVILKALGELGPRQLWRYAGYQTGLRSGYYRWLTPPGNPADSPIYPISLDLIPLPYSTDILAVLDEKARQELCAQADEICDGQVRLFGGPPVALHLTPPGQLRHWTAYGACLVSPDTGETEDIKWTWEPARCAWGIHLGRAAFLTGNASYTAAFWEYARQFWTANPPNLGPNWSSAQEIALRLISICLGARLCSVVQEPSPAEMELLSHLVASHAGRLPLTLSYAQAQNNNHLLSEAAGLFTAGIVLAAHPEAARWRALGWDCFNRGLQRQIALGGSYTQNSANYHRLMLQLALWVNLLASAQGDHLPPTSRDQLAAGTHWLLDLVDPVTGGAPNLGPNDGAYLFPLSAAPQTDFRPALQAASLAFLGKSAFPAGGWDEMSQWLVPVPARMADASVEPPSSTGLLVLRPPESSSWAYLRAANFTGRPGHADQLHLDLWWRGLNIAVDPGTFLYNAPPPWDNSLARTAVHNTLMLEDQEQMTLAGRFLWLDRAQAQVLAYQPLPVNGSMWAAAEHYGYRRLGLTHRRTVRWDGIGWQVEDDVIPTAARASSDECSISIHWLLPDFPWQFLQEAPPRLTLQTPQGAVSLIVAASGAALAPGNSSFQLVRAGALLSGEGEIEPTWGWRSPTYGYKEPALAFCFSLRGKLPVRLVTRWEFLALREQPASVVVEG